MPKGQKTEPEPSAGQSDGLVPPPDAAPAPRRRRSTYRNGEVTRERVIVEAQHAVADLGFGSASSREVARRSGVTFGVIQHHFGSHQAMLEVVAQKGSNDLERLLVEAEPQGTTTHERLSWLVDLLWGYFARPAFLTNIEIYTNLIRDPNIGPSVHDRIQDEVARNEQAWDALIQRSFGATTGGVPLRRLFFASLQGLAIDRFMGMSRPGYEAERALLVDMLLPFFTVGEQAT